MGDGQAGRETSRLKDPTIPGTPGLPSSAVRDQAGPRPTISVCVPTFRRPVLVQRAIRSIVESASHEASEVEIIVSDNSPDVSEDACRQALAPWTGRSLYIPNRKNIGLATNFNQCISRASGRYILFVHDDDRLLPGALPAILDALAAVDEPAHVLLFQVRVEDETGRILRKREFRSDEWVDARHALHRLLSDNGLAWFPGLVVSRDAYAAVGPFDADIGNATDIEMWVRLFSRYGVRYVPRTISGYTVHAQRATETTTFDGDSVAQLMDIFDRARRTGVLRDETIGRCEVQYLHQVILGTAYFHLRSGDVAGARRILALFDLPAVRSLGRSLTWLPVRLIFGVLVRSPVSLVHLLMRLVDRLDVVRRVREAGTHGRGRLRR